MTWKDLLDDGRELVAPWVGGRTLHHGQRGWFIEGKLPREHGWYKFQLHPRRAVFADPAEPDLNFPFDEHAVGYLVGDRLIRDGVASRVKRVEISKIPEYSVPVHLLDPGLERFVRVRAKRIFYMGPFIFINQEFPLGPEDDVLQAYLDHEKNVDEISGVSPALDLAFRLETWQRDEAEKERKRELERLEREQRERELVENRRRLMERLGDGAGRRETARVDFRASAEAALAVGGAEFLDYRDTPNRGEYAVTFRLMGRRFQCVCNVNLRIIDAGICLVDHATDKKYDNYFTLESLPGVIQQAEREHRLVVFRHV